VQGFAGASRSGCDRAGGQGLIEGRKGEVARKLKAKSEDKAAMSFLPAGVADKRSMSAAELAAAEKAAAAKDREVRESPSK